MAVGRTVTTPGGSGDLARIGERLERVRRRIAVAGGDLARIRIVAVTKGFGLDELRAAVALGCVDVGENYAHELVTKAAAVGASLPVRWHFLGAVQRNKLARLAPLVACYQGVDRLEEGEAIAARAPGAEVLVEVNAAGLPGRPGVPPGEVPSLVAALERLDLAVRGLMTVAPPERETARRCFETVAALVADLGLEEASMGMSDDLELAVAAGSTMVRVGRALFGSRPARPAPETPPARPRVPQ
ncbi:MAG TPA: YggS family pyridoxal phosphate enzyme [Acidimicrobiales bacterium]|nr:YggS family pyridoxal phosphate enzyme [Acidimicrobiales bacterium]